MFIVSEYERRFLYGVRYAAILLLDSGRNCGMNKQEIKFAVVTKGRDVVAIGRSQVLQPEIRFSGGTIKWLDD